MIVLYVISGVCLVVVSLILIGMIWALVSHITSSLEKRVSEVRKDLLKRETKTGSAVLYSGSYSKISDEMLRDLAESEGFHVVDKTSSSIGFQRTPARAGEETGYGRNNPMQPRGGIGHKKHRELLYERLTENGEQEKTLVLRRDELKALPKLEILEAARDHGWTYRDEEISGNEWRLLFGLGAEQSEHAEVIETDPATEQAFRALLDEATPDVSGRARLDLGALSARLPMSKYRELASGRGWDVAEPPDETGEMVLRKKTPGRAPATPRTGPQFISGPSLAELRDNELARAEAAEVLRETGVDVLSSATLDEARHRHVALRRRVVRLGWLCALPAVFALTGVLFAPVLWGDGDTQAGNVLMVAALVAAALFAVLLPLPIRAEKARKAGVSDYTSAYERVVAAVLYPQDSSKG